MTGYIGPQPEPRSANQSDFQPGAVSSANPPQYYYPRGGYYSPKPEKQHLPLTTNDKVFALLFLLWGILWVDFVAFGGLNLGFTLSTALLFVLLILYLQKGRLRLYPLICGLSAVAGTVPFALYNDSQIRSVAFAAVVGLLALYGSQTTGNDRFSAGSFRCVYDLVCTVFVYPFEYCGIVCRSLLKKETAGQKKKGNGGRIFIGLLCSVPVLLVVVPLLMRSNEYFEQLLSSLTMDLGRLVLSVVFGTGLFIFLFAVAVAWKKGLIKEGVAPTFRSKGIDPIIVQTFLTVLSVVYLVYLFTQTAYFFSAFDGILPLEYSDTVADYARRGFFEMCAVAAINLGLLFFTMLLVKKQEGKIPLFSRILGSFLCLFTLLLIGTALSKMFLYIQGFGLTRLRVITSVFMIFLVFVFVAVCIRLFVPKFPYMKAVILSFCAIGLTLAFMDVDTKIARYNVTAYQTGRLDTVDVETLTQLSDGTIPYLIELSYDEDGAVASAAHNALVEHFVDQYEIECNCGLEICPHESVSYYATNEYGTNYHTEEYGHVGWLYEEEGPKIVSITLREENKMDLRSYNRSVAQKQALLWEHREHILAKVDLYSPS